MPKTVHIRDIDDEVYAALQRHAAAAGMSVPELLRREAKRLPDPADPKSGFDKPEQLVLGVRLVLASIEEIVKPGDERHGA